MNNKKSITNEGQRAFTYQNHVVLGVVLLCAAIAVAMVQYKIPTILTSIMALFAMDAATASWLMSIFTLMGIVFAIPSGWLAQKFGAKNMVIVALGISILGSVIGAFAGTSTVLIFSRAIEGIALTVLTTCGPVVIQRCVPPERIGSTMGIWGIWGCLGSTFAALITPTLFELAGFSGLWIAFAGICVAAALLVLFIVRMPPADFFPTIEAASRQSSSSNEAAIVNKEPIPKGLAAYKAIFSKDMVLFFLAFGLFNIFLLAIPSFVPTILQMQGFDPTLSGFISTAPMLMSVVTSPLFGVLSDKVRRVKIFLVVCLVAMGPCTFLMYTNTGVLLWVGVVIMGIFGLGSVGLFLSGFTKLLPRPELASTGMGALICFQGLGQFLGTFFIQALLGPNLMNWSFAGIVLMVLGFVGAAAIALTKMK